MENAKIDSKQLFSLMFLFQLGTGIVTRIGLQAKQDAWISIFLGMFGALILFFLVYLQIFKQYPTLPFTGILVKVFSKYIGIPLSLVYISYFFFVASVNARHLGDTMGTYILSETPVPVIIFISLALVAYACYLGIEVIGRTAEILFAAMVVFGLTGNLTVIASGIIKLKNLQPILEYGWLPVLKHSVPLMIFFPFGEVFLFLMIFPYLNKPDLVKRTGLLSILLSGLGLSWTFLLIISVIGIGAQNVEIPLLSAVEKINVGHIIQRMDSIVVGTFAVGFFIKIILYVYAVLIGLTDIFKFKRYQPLIFPVVSLIFLYSLVWANNKVTYQGFFYNKMPYLVGFPLLVGMPVIVLIMILVRNYFGTSRANIPK
ncbi:endospore germination permease [Neobacillus cucumis]|uniref:GerAB/ArcD/ProY family transporter n=1 Tax=Neobacillus cucumis TaxID=1740721 RepID=UPI0018E01322|nr:endospore germination permease [Neobacillus cucumis]MBI0579317.1 endospore germination permease [Neobacillus cucumis]